MTSEILRKTDSIFLPKKTIVRPDGASLMDVYESKQNDLWGKIIQAQYKEDEGKLILIYMCNFHVLTHLLLIYICKFHWKITKS